jgi:hypothetical protein
MVDVRIRAWAVVQARQVLPFALKAGASFAEVVTGDQDKQPRSGDLPVHAQDFRHSSARCFRFARQNGICACSYVEHMEDERMPSLATRFAGLGPDICQIVIHSISALGVQAFHQDAETAATSNE